MPKNTGKGGKTRKRGKNDHDQSKRDIIMKSPGEAYAAVIGPLGQYQMALRLEDMTPAKGIIRGNLRKKVWIVGGDCIRVQLREGYEDGTVDIVGKYTADEARELVRLNEVPAAMLSGPQAQADNSRAGAQAIRFVSQTGANAADAGKEKISSQDQAAADLQRIMRGANPNRSGAGIGNSDDETDSDDGHMQWRANKRGGDSDDDEEDEEDEEGEEGEEEEEDDEADASYDPLRDAMRDEWSQHHKKEADYKQRNKRFGQSAGQGKNTVKKEDLDDI